MADDYLHGFSPEEQARLVSQADFLAPWLYPGLPLPQRGVLLEVGAGVGAQTTLLAGWTQAHLLCLERDARQLEAFGHQTAGLQAQGRVTALRGDAEAMPLADRSVDGAYICWVLEHVPHPERVLAEARRVLKPGAPLVAIEVQNGSLTTWPTDPMLGRIWKLINEAQQALGGDPYVGARLGALVAQAGFEQVSLSYVPVQGDARDPKRREAVIRYFHRLLQSALPTLHARGLGWPTLEADLDRVFDGLCANPDAAWLYTFARATAVCP
jgi:SAM-dependent methyltransferase